jgi:hypothetical protein
MMLYAHDIAHIFDMEFNKPFAVRHFNNENDLISANEVKQWQMTIKRGIDKKRFWLEYGRYNQQRVKCSFSFSTIHEKMGGVV